MYRKQIRVVLGLRAHAIPISTLFALHLPPSHQPGHNILINNDAVAIHFRFLQKAAAMKNYIHQKTVAALEGNLVSGKITLAHLVFLHFFIYIFFCVMMAIWSAGQQGWLILYGATLFFLHPTQL